MSIYNHTYNDRTPYTYLVGWSAHNKWYYGVRYGKNCHPSDLFTTYFTSSKYVKLFIKKHGLPDIIQIRKIFNSSEDALRWEQKVLSKMNVSENNKFINVRPNTTNAIITKPNKGSFKKGRIQLYNNGANIKGKKWYNNGVKNKLFFPEKQPDGWNLGLLYNEDTRKKVIEKIKDIWENNEELREKYRIKTLQQFSDPIKKQLHKNNCKPHSDKIWITNGVNNKRIFEKDFDNYFGWRKGRYIKEDTLTKMINNRQNNRDPKTGRFIKKGE